VRARNFGHKLAFIDPSRTSQTSMDMNERDVDDYIIDVFEKCKDQDLVVWPFHKK
jgi:hypothetical protein